MSTLQAYNRQTYEHVTRDGKCRSRKLESIKGFCSYCLNQSYIKLSYSRAIQSGITNVWGGFLLSRLAYASFAYFLSTCFSVVFIGFWNKLRVYEYVCIMCPSPVFNDELIFCFILIFFPPNLTNRTYTHKTSKTGTWQQKGKPS